MTDTLDVPALKELIAASKMKAFAEGIGMTWAEWLALPVARRDRLILAVWRA